VGGGKSGISRFYLLHFLWLHGSGCMISVPFSDVSVAGIVGSGFDDWFRCLFSVPFSVKSVLWGYFYVKKRH